MKKSFKKILSAALVITTLFGSIGAGLVGLDSGGLFAPKASAASILDLTYEIENGEAGITGCDKNASGKLVIPAAIMGKPVTRIGGWSFSDCCRLESVTIPDSVTSIGWYAFFRCTSLTSVKIGNGVTSIGDDAFYRCKSLTSVTIPDSVTSIGKSAFEDCDSLTSVTIPDGVTSIGEDAFAYCPSLTAITVGKNNQNYCDIDGVLFNKDKTELIKYPPKKAGAEYTIPDGVTKIDSHAFDYCTSLTSVTIPDGVTEICYGAFWDCTSLKSVTIPDGVTGIGGYAFKDCSSLTSVTIPDGVTSISYKAFMNCTSLTSVTIPDGVTSIGELAFSGCSGLTSVTIPDGVTKIESSTFSGCSSLTSVTIPDSVTSIGQYAFRDCTSLTSVTIPGSVTSIGSSAFRNTGIYNDENNWENGVLYIGNHLIEAERGVVSGDYTIKAGTKTIADFAFCECYGLTSVAIPDSVTSIGDWAFFDCTSLTSVTIGNGLTEIGGDLLYNSNLAEITVASGNPNYSSLDGVLFNKDKTILIQYPRGNARTAYTIPDGVTSIGDYAFEDCRNLKSVTIPDSVTEIGYAPFKDCTSLRDVAVDANNPNYYSRFGSLYHKGDNRLVSNQAALNPMITAKAIIAVIIASILEVMQPVVYTAMLPVIAFVVPFVFIL